jgi:nitroreductase
LTWVVVEMEVFEAIWKRHSVRAYLRNEVPGEKMGKILEAGRLAPSAGNIQPWHFIVVTDQQRRNELSKGRYAKFLTESPVVLVGCGDKKASPNWYVVDTTIAMQNMVLTATSEGLDTCWIGSFNENQVKELLNVPERFSVVALLALSYGRKKMDLGSKVLHFFRRRKKMEKIVSLEEFGNPIVKST